MQSKATRATPENRGAAAVAAYRGERQKARPPTRPRQIFELEDYLLAGWVLVMEEAARRWTGEPLQLIDELGGGMAADAGLVGWMASLSSTGWVVLLLFLFILLTRGPEDTDRDVALHRRTPMLALATPVLSIYALIASGIQALLFGPTARPDGAPPPWPGPFVPRAVRRTAAVPLALLGDAVFRAEIANAGIETVSVSSLSDGVSLSVLFVTLASAFPFMVFVAGPRIAAGAVMAWRPWIIRFGLFYGALWASNAGFTW